MVLLVVVVDIDVVIGDSVAADTTRAVLPTRARAETSFIFYFVLFFSWEGRVGLCEGMEVRASCQELPMGFPHVSLSAWCLVVLYKYPGPAYPTPRGSDELLGFMLSSHRQAKTHGVLQCENPSVKAR